MLKLKMLNSSNCDIVAKKRNFIEQLVYCQQVNLSIVERNYRLIIVKFDITSNYRLTIIKFDNRQVMISFSKLGYMFIGTSL